MPDASATPLSYGVQPRKWWRPVVKWSLATGAALLVLWLGMTVTVGEYTWQMDRVTGSTKRQTRWFFGVTSTTTTASSLETRLAAIGDTPKPQWQFISSSGFTLFGIQTYCGVGTKPPIFRLSNALEPFLESATDEQIQALADTLTNGTPDDQQSALVEAIEKTDREKPFSGAAQPPVISGASAAAPHR